MFTFLTHGFPPPSDPAKAPLLRERQLPPHGGQSDGGGVQPGPPGGAHPHRTVPLHRLRPLPNGEDRRRETQLQVQSRHCLNLPGPVPPDRTVTLHRQVSETQEIQCSLKKYLTHYNDHWGVNYSPDVTLNS